MRRSREEVLAEKKMKAERAAARKAAAAAKRATIEAKRQAMQERSAAARAAREASAARVAASRAPEPPPKRSKEMTRAERELHRIAKMERERMAERTRDLRRAGIDYDPRTAAGQREYDVRSMGGSNTARLDRFNKLFRNQVEATKARIAACEAFDGICHAAASGLFPEPKFAPGVDCSGVSSIPEDRAYGLEQLASLKAKIGDDFLAVLTARVHMSMTYTAMESAGYGDRNALASLFTAAVDAVARFYRIGGKSPMVEAAEAVFKRA